MADEVPAPPSMAEAIRRARAGKPLPGSLEERLVRVRAKSMSPEQVARTGELMRARLTYDHMEER